MSIYRVFKRWKMNWCVFFGVSMILCIVKWVFLGMLLFFIVLDCRCEKFF